MLDASGTRIGAADVAEREASAAAAAADKAASDDVEESRITLCSDVESSR